MYLYVFAISQNWTLVKTSLHTAPLRRGTKLSAVDLGVTMMDRDKWRAVVEDSLGQREVP